MGRFENHEFVANFADLIDRYHASFLDVKGDPTIDALLDRVLALLRRAEVMLSVPVSSQSHADDSDDLKQIARGLRVAICRLWTLVVQGRKRTTSLLADAEAPPLEAIDLARLSAIDSTVQRALFRRYCDLGGRKDYARFRDQPAMLLPEPVSSRGHEMSNRFRDRQDD